MCHCGPSNASVDSCVQILNDCSTAPHAEISVFFSYQTLQLVYLLGLSWYVPYNEDGREMITLCSCMLVDHSHVVLSRRCRRPHVNDLSSSVCLTGVP